MRGFLMILIVGLIIFACQKVADINPASDGLFIKFYGNNVGEGQSTDAGSMVINGSEIVVVGTKSNPDAKALVGEDLPPDIYLLKTDLIGKIITEEIFVDSVILNNDTIYFNNYGRDIKIAPEGGYYILGERDSIGDKDLILLKVGNDLTTEWSRVLDPLSENEEAKALSVNDDGSLAILGEYVDISGDRWSFLYVYFPDNPDNSWYSEPQYGAANIDQTVGKTILPTESQGYSFPSTRDNEAMLLITDHNGDAEIPPTLGTGASGVDLLKFGAQYVMLSNNYKGGIADSISVFRIESNDESEVTEEKIGPGNLEGSSIAATQDGFVITGSIDHGSQRDIILIKTDHNIGTKWTPAYKSFGGNGDDYGVKVAAIENGYIILGISQVAGLRMITLIRTDLEGNLVTN